MGAGLMLIFPFHETLAARVIQLVSVKVAYRPTFILDFVAKVEVVPLKFLLILGSLIR